MGQYEEVCLYTILLIAKNAERKAPRSVKGLAGEKKVRFASLSDALKQYIREPKQTTSSHSRRSWRK
jgi:hypothetical protein